jgi:predicted kinase
MICYMLIGLPGSGKSTWARTQNLPILSSDQFIEEKALREGSTYDKIFKDTIKEATSHFNRVLAETIAARKEFIVDRTNMNRVSRGKLFQLLQGYLVEGHVWTVSPETCLERLARRTGKSISPDVVYNMWAGFEYPCLEEGFDAIIEHN